MNNFDKGYQMRSRSRLAFSLLCWLLVFSPAGAGELQRLGFNNPGLVVDLGVGLWAWPLPMDYDRDGDIDLVVVCPDVPYEGAYFFENPGGGRKMPIFRPAVRLGRAVRNAQVSYFAGIPRVLTPGTEYADFREHQFGRPQELGIPADFHKGRIRANQWKYCDYDADGALDLIVGIGDWQEYGWDNAFNNQGVWENGPLHGYVYLLSNSGTNEKPRYADPAPLLVDGAPIDVFGMPSPNLDDFDGDGDLDLICGEFLDKFSYFENTGSRPKPIWAAARRLTVPGSPIEMDLQMITPTAVDWDGDGDVDLVVGDEDGRVALIEHTGRVTDRVPQFLEPRYFQQQADSLKFGALVTPDSFDWDGDGDEDLICGNTAGYIGFIENLDGGNPPRWAAPRRLEDEIGTIRIQAGPAGSIQGPCEAKWGYTAPSVADWNHDGLPDLVVNSIWGKVVWFKNIGTRRNPKLSQAQPLTIAWKDGRPSQPAWNWWTPEGGELATQWRTTPLAVDWNQDGLNDLVALDHQGYLAFYERTRIGGELRLLPPQRVFSSYEQHTFDSRHAGQPDGDGLLRLNGGIAGRSGRRKLAVADWNGDGRQDLLVNSLNVSFLENVGRSNGQTWFRDRGTLSAQRLAGHTTSPTVVDWNRDGELDLLIGAEDGMFYHLAR